MHNFLCTAHHKDKSEVCSSLCNTFATHFCFIIVVDNGEEIKRHVSPLIDNSLPFQVYSQGTDSFIHSVLVDPVSYSCMVGVTADGFKPSTITVAKVVKNISDSFGISIPSLKTIRLQRLAYIFFVERLPSVVVAFGFLHDFSLRAFCGRGKTKVMRNITSFM